MKTVNQPAMLFGKTDGSNMVKVCRTVTITRVDDEEWHVDHPSCAFVSIHMTPAAALKRIQYIDRREANGIKGAAAIITTIEWCNTPADFTPPKGA